MSYHSQKQPVVPTYLSFFAPLWCYCTWNSRRNAWNQHTGCLYCYVDKPYNWLQCNKKLLLYFCINSWMTFQYNTWLCWPGGADTLHAIAVQHAANCLDSFVLYLNIVICPKYNRMASEGCNQASPITQLTWMRRNCSAISSFIPFCSWHTKNTV